MGDWTEPGLGDFEGMNPERVRRILLRAAGMSHTHAKGHPVWLFAGEVFRVGPQVGMNLCIHAGLDPFICVRALPTPS
ncbi:MAG: hypothetical protein ACREUE_01320 [Panacagrimonas sp.]